MITALLVVTTDKPANTLEAVDEERRGKYEPGSTPEEDRRTERG